MATTQIRGNTQIIAGTITNAEINASAAIASSKLADGTNFLKKDGSVALTASLDLGSHTITNVTDPSNPQDAATKAYVDATAQGLDVKASVRVATTAAITLSGTQTIDGVALSVGDRVLVKDQADGTTNGIYLVASSGWTRATDANTSAKVTGGLFTFATEGTANSDSGWILTTNDTITLGTTALAFTQFSGAGQITAGAGLTKTGNTLDVVGTANRIVVAADSIDIGTDVVTLTGLQTLTNKSIVATQLTGTLQAAQFPTLTGDITTAGGALGTTITNSVVSLAKLANLAANSVIGNSTGSAAVPTAVPLSASSSASSIILRDANSNAYSNNYLSAVATTATAGATTTLTAASARTQQFTGSTTQTVVLPDATTLTNGHIFNISNRSSGVVTVNANGGGLQQAMAGSSQLSITLVSNGTTAGTWDVAYSTGAAGTVTTVSVVSANGFAGTVATASTTPAITLTTSITGILKGSSSALVAATVGTDYVNNASFVTRETPSGAVNSSNVTFVLANTPTASTECVFLNGILQEPGAGNDYTISGATITYLTAPTTGDKIRVNYMK